MTGSDVFSPTDINTMVVDQDDMAKTEVSIRLMGSCTKTDRTCLVHPVPQMMLPSYPSDGYCGLCPMQSISMSIKPVNHNVKMLREDTGCTAGRILLYFSSVS
jgi:hypothetical protein